MTSNPQPKPYHIFSTIYVFFNQTEEQICFPIRKQDFL